MRIHHQKFWSWLCAVCMEGSAGRIYRNPELHEISKSIWIYVVGLYLLYRYFLFTFYLSGCSILSPFVSLTCGFYLLFFFFFWVAASFGLFSFPCKNSPRRKSSTCFKCCLSWLLYIGHFCLCKRFLVWTC